MKQHCGCCGCADDGGDDDDDDDRLLMLVKSRWRLEIPNSRMLCSTSRSALRVAVPIGRVLGFGTIAPSLPCRCRSLSSFFIARVPTHTHDRIVKETTACPRGVQHTYVTEQWEYDWERSVVERVVSIYDGLHRTPAFLDDEGRVWYAKAESERTSLRGEAQRFSRPRRRLSYTLVVSHHVCARGTCLRGAKDKRQTLVTIFCAKVEWSKGCVVCVVGH